MPIYLENFIKMITSEGGGRNGGASGGGGGNGVVSGHERGIRGGGRWCQWQT